MDLLRETTQKKRVPKPPPPAPKPNRPTASPPRIFITMKNIKTHLTTHHKIPIQLVDAHDQWNNGKAVVDAYHRQAANMSIYEQHEYESYIQKGYYMVNGSAITKPSNHCLDRLIKKQACWAKYVFLNALFPNKMESIDQSVRRSLGDLNVEDYSILYKNAAKGNPQPRPTWMEIEASRLETTEARKAQERACDEQERLRREAACPANQPKQTSSNADFDHESDDDLTPPNVSQTRPLSTTTAQPLKRRRFSPRPFPNQIEHATNLPTQIEPISDAVETTPTFLDKGTQTEPFTSWADEYARKKRAEKWAEDRFRALVEEHGMFCEGKNCVIRKNGNQEHGILLDEDEHLAREETDNGKE
ncbi:hypothetical protein HDV63DRAFT_69315 [Trichoderma sp. SZMC 28014]